MKRTILVTGSEGLIGTSLCTALFHERYAVRPFDIAIDPNRVGHGDVTVRSMLNVAMQGCVGVVHLGAVSRVVWGQREPERCWKTNAIGSQNVVNAALNMPCSPWVVVASSREVYGQSVRLPVKESAPIAPINVYGRSKARAEEAVTEAQESGLRSCVVRFSNVYGSICDHSDRVVPAFCTAAINGGVLRVEGPERTFDFTHVHDAVAGLCAVIKAFESGAPTMTPIHLATGVGTRLGQLATMAWNAAGQRGRVEHAGGREYDVTHFIGDSSRARELLGWRPKIGIACGVRGMVRQILGNFDEGWGVRQGGSLPNKCVPGPRGNRKAATVPAKSENGDEY